MCETSQFLGFLELFCFVSERAAGFFSSVQGICLSGFWHELGGLRIFSCRSAACWRGALLCRLAAPCGQGLRAEGGCGFCFPAVWGGCMRVGTIVTSWLPLLRAFPEVLL